MGFKKMTKAKYPPRLWSLVGYAGAGKSTFASQMKGPMVVVDADHRFQEVMELSGAEVYELSDVKSDNVDPDRINTLLMKNMPGTKVETIVVDSLTAIITPLVVQAMIDHDSGKQKNLAAAFRTKALAMRQLQDAVTRWGCDVLWIYHHQDARDGRANEVKRATISPTEQARLTRSINVQLEIAMDERNNRRGIKVAWARRGRSGMVIWDDSGHWEGMPQKIEEAIYEGLTPEEQEQIEQENPTHFTSPEHAQAWGVDKGAFPDVEAARRGYAFVKKEYQPSNAREMAQVWITYVEEQMHAETPADVAGQMAEEVAVASTEDDDCPF